MQNQLTGALIGLARAVDSAPRVTENTYAIMIEGLAATADAGPDQEVMEKMLARVRLEREILVPDCSRCAAPCGRNAEFDMAELDQEEEKIRALKMQLLDKIRARAVSICRAEEENDCTEEENRFFCQALFLMGYDADEEMLLELMR